MAIQTNKIEAEINHVALDNKYDFFVLTTTEKYIKGGAMILDAPSSILRVQAIHFTSGKSFFVMVFKSADNKNKLKELIQSYSEGRYLTINQLNSTDLEEKDLLQLLINGLSNSRNPLLGFSNLTGHLYCFHPSWLKHKRTGSQEEIVKVPCLEFHVVDENKLLIDVRTFSSVKLKNKITFRKKKFEEYPKYSFATNNTLKRITKSCDEASYILRQTDGAKTEIPFLDILNTEKYMQSKMGVLSAVIEQFNKVYVGEAAIKFSSIDEYKRIDHKKKADEENKSRVVSILKQNKIRIVDQIGNGYSEEFCKTMSILLERKYGIKPSLGTRLSKNGLNIVLIHNAAYYIDVEDPHDVVKSNYAIQHVTLEDFSNSAEFAITTVVNELIIKDDLRSGKITLFDWKRLSFQGDFIFGTEIVENEIKKYLFMRIHPDGSFVIHKCEFDLFSANEYMKYAKIYEDAKTASETVRGIISDDKGNINIIKDTDWFTIPNINCIKSELEKGNTKIRGKEARMRFLDAILDIKWFQNGEDVFYFANDIGDGMRTLVQRAANIRKIVAHENSELFFDKISPLFDVTFVRNGQLTVVPFPFKYLREDFDYMKKVNEDD